MESVFEEQNGILLRAYKLAEEFVNGDAGISYTPEMKDASDLAKLKHAFRGAALTLLSYKLLVPDQDIRCHKEEYEGGFSARRFDTRVTVPFLIEHSLPRSVETHWLTQTLSFAGPLTMDVVLKTVPKKAGPLLLKVVNNAQSSKSLDAVFSMLVAIMVELIKIRNKDRVVLTRPKDLPIEAIKTLLNSHFSRKYKNNAPRLPQLAIYAIYQCLLGKMKRFEGKKLEKLQRMKAADRKAGTVGDIVVFENEKPIEAVEVKFDQPITDIHVCEAIEKVRAELVKRYYLLSTKGILVDDVSQIKDRTLLFLKQNGCEIIVNGVIETITYYLRLLPDTTDFLNNYADLIETDDDTGYEHRIAWNELCAEIKI